MVCYPKYLLSTPRAVRWNFIFQCSFSILRLGGAVPHQDRAAGNEVSSDLPGLVTLGGCVVGHLAASLNGQVILHRRHMWRRPTIAMMSDPVSRFRIDFAKLPVEFANYFVNDAGGKHQAELKCRSAEKERVFVFDVTRDVFTGVVEIEPDVWIMDPVDAITMVEGLTHETMSGEILEEICRDSVRRVSAVRSWEEWFPIWKSAFERFAVSIDGQYERILIAEIYPTLERYDTVATFYAVNIEVMNERLDHMYAWIRENFDFEWIGIPRDRAITGATGVPYGGPTPTHFIGETHGLIAMEFIRTLNSGFGDNHPKFDAVRPLVDQAFERAKLHEEALEEISNLKSQIETLTGRVNAAEAQLAERDAEIVSDRLLHTARMGELETELAIQTATNAALTVEMNAAVERQSEADAVVHAFVLGQYNDAQSALLASHARIEILEGRLSSLNAVLASPLKIMKRSLARKSRKIRGK